MLCVRLIHLVCKYFHSIQQYIVGRWADGKLQVLTPSHLAVLFLVSPHASTRRPSIPNSCLHHICSLPLMTAKVMVPPRLIKQRQDGER